jgi:hypothetical protein
MPHPEFKKPSDNAIIWRFMNIEKFLSMLKFNSLYFTQVRELAKIFDAHEGKYNRETLELMKKEDEPYIVNRINKFKLNLSRTDPLPTIEHLTKPESRAQNSIIDSRRIYANCWYIGESESNLIWESYGKRNLSIGIKSTVKRLCDSLNKSEYTIHLGKVYYDEIPISDNSYVPFLNKRKFFKDEKELRAIIRKDWGNNHENYYGFNVKVDLNILIETIYVKPKTKSYVNLCLQDIINKYNLDKKVLSSEINEKLSDYYSEFNNWI